MIRRHAVARVFRWRVPVWQPDLDAFAELKTSALLRLLQETATRASTDAGFDPRYYERAGTMWLVRRTTLEVLAAGSYGDELEVTTWVTDFRRVRSRRDYEIQVGERVVARAHTDWVYVDRLHGRPARIPDAIQTTFVPHGAPAIDRAPFPGGTPPADATSRRRRVEVHELDALRHVNNAAYVNYVEQAALDAAAAVGWGFAAQLAAGGRLRAVAHDLEYLDAALADEPLEVLTWLRSVSADGVERHTWVRRPDSARPLLRALSTYRWTDVASAQARALPAELRRVLMLSVVRPELRAR